VGWWWGACRAQSNICEAKTGAVVMASCRPRGVRRCHLSAEPSDEGSRHLFITSVGPSFGPPGRLLVYPRADVGSAGEVWVEGRKLLIFAGWVRLVGYRDRTVCMKANGFMQKLPPVKHTYERISCLNEYGA